jgi:hypothetical protein
MQSVSATEMSAFLFVLFNEDIIYQNDTVLVTHDLNDEKIKLLRQKPVPVTSCPQQIPHRLAWD